MRRVLIIILAGFFVCLLLDSPASEDSVKKQEHTIITLEGLAPIDPSSQTTQHPLVCGEGGDFPSGHEIDFRLEESGGSLHAVFPEEVTPPKSLAGKFVLSGYYQGIQKRTGYTLKKPADDYKYFVVISWKQSE